MALLVDTGILYALADRDDAWHRRSRRYLERHRDLLLAPATVLPEVSHLLRARLGAEVERSFVEAVAAGEVAVEALREADYRRTAVLMADYPAIGFVDASLVAIAERLELATLATTDRRHFATLRPRHLERFALVP